MTDMTPGRQIAQWWETATEPTEQSEHAAKIDAAIAAARAEGELAATERAAKIDIADDTLRFAHLVRGDNRVVPVPVWLAEKLHSMLDSYLKGEPRTMTPCWRAEEQDAVECLERLTTIRRGTKDTTKGA